MHLMPMSPRLKPERPWWRKPLVLFLRIRPRRRHLRGSVAHRIFGSRLFEHHLWIPDRDSAAKGMAVGVFIGLLPLLGLQIILSAVLCYFMRANLAAATLATFISNPFTAAGILYAQVKLGQWLAPALVAVDISQYTGLGKFLMYGKPLVVGSLVSAAIGGLIAYPLTHWVWKVGEDTVKKRRAKRLQARLAKSAAEFAELPQDEPT